MSVMANSLASLNANREDSYDFFLLEPNLELLSAESLSEEICRHLADAYLLFAYTYFPSHKIVLTR